MESITVFVPGLRVESEANSRAHWSARNRRRKAQADAVLLALHAWINSIPHYPKALRIRRDLESLLVRVTMTRLYAGRQRAMDTDNLDGAFKFVRDAIALWLHRDDGPRSGVEWATGQERGDEAGVRICLEAVAAQ